MKDDQKPKHGTLEQLRKESDEAYLEAKETAKLWAEFDSSQNRPVWWGRASWTGQIKMRLVTFSYVWAGVCCPFTVYAYICGFKQWWAFAALVVGFLALGDMFFERCTSNRVVTKREE